MLQETLPDIPESLPSSLLLCGAPLALILVAAAFLLIRRRAARRPAAAVQPASRGELTSAGPAPLMQWESTYELGMDGFDEACSIEAEDGEMLGECGIGISEVDSGRGMRPGG